MTFSLWNLISIVTVVNMLPKDSTCHHGHTSSALLNGHRWYYTLSAHADFLISVRLRCFFLLCNMPMSASDSLLMSASLCPTFQDVICATFMPTSRSLSISTLSASSSALHQSSGWDKGLSEGAWTHSLWSHVTLSIWKVTQRVEKNSIFSCMYSFQLILRPVSEHEEPNKQRGIGGQSEGAETETHRWT